MREFLKDITIATLGALWWIFKLLFMVALVITLMVFVIVFVLG